MTSAIKPPGPGVPAADAPGTVEPGAPARREGVSPTGATFRAAVEVPTPRPAIDDRSVDVERLASPARADALSALVADVRAGRLSAEQAVERLVSRAVAGGLVSGLPPDRRAALEATLRATLTEDPTMIAMQRDLARAR